LRRTTFVHMGTLRVLSVATSLIWQAADFATITARTPAAQLPVFAVSGATISVAAGRLSFVLGMQGACYTADTACSTALVVAHGAAAMVATAECEDVL
jgi:acyl transferase domain-containing protein